jgi:hypothetical protein
MASFHFEIKSGRKGAAAEHAAYIARQGWHSRRNDLVFSGHGNLPSWACDDPSSFWRGSDRYERVNGTTYREMVIALPAELSFGEQWSLVDHLVCALAGPKPHQFAVHAPESSIQREINPHLHLMVSDRTPDGIERPASKMFSRYNAMKPEEGGCRKDSGGRTRMQVRDELVTKRKLVADIQNEHLALHGHSARVDHRTLKDQGLQREAERHLGHVRINKMTTDERDKYIEVRGHIRQMST